MIGPKISTVFQSRWNALFWSAGVLLTAYCSVPSPDEKDDPAVSVDAAKQVAQLLNAGADTK